MWDDSKRFSKTFNNVLAGTHTHTQPPSQTIQYQMFEMLLRGILLILILKSIFVLQVEATFII